MTTRNIETPFFPLIVEVSDDFVGNVLVEYREEIARQLEVIIAKSPNAQAVDYARRMLKEIDDAR